MKFELFGRFKAKKNHSHTNIPSNESPASQKTTSTPQNSVKQQQDANFHEANIINNLKSQGMGYDEIDKTLNQNIKNAVLNQSGDGTLFYNEDFVQGLDQNNELQNSNTATRFGTPKEDLRPLIYEVEQPVSNTETEDTSEDYEILMEEVEEIVNNILEKKYTKFEDLKTELSNQISDIDERISSLEKTLESISSKLDNLEKDTEKKMESVKVKYEQLYPQLEGVEKAFKDIIPNLVDAVKELQERLDQEPGKKTTSKTDEMSNLLQEDLKNMTPSSHTSKTKVSVSDEDNSKKHKDKKSNNDIDDFDYTELIS